MIVDAKPRDLGLPTDAYYSVEEVHDVSEFSKMSQDLTSSIVGFSDMTI